MFRNLEAEIDPLNKLSIRRAFVLQGMEELRVRILAAEVLSSYGKAAGIKALAGGPGLQNGSVTHGLTRGLIDCAEGGAGRVTVNYGIPKLDWPAQERSGLNVYSQHICLGSESVRGVIFDLSISDPLINRGDNHDEHERQRWPILGDFNIALAEVADGGFADVSLPSPNTAYRYYPLLPPILT